LQILNKDDLVNKKNSFMSIFLSDAANEIAESLADIERTIQNRKSKIENQY